MEADDALRFELAHEWCYERADVTALDAVAIVTKPGHQLGERLGDTAVGPSRFIERGRKRKTGNRGDYHMKGIGGIAAMRRGIGQRSDQLDELDEGAGPAMDEHQWGGVR